LSRKNEIGKNFPEYWLVIYTLPNRRVDAWNSHDYNKSDPLYQLMRSNPHQFYRRALKDPRSFYNPKRSPNIADYPGILEYTEKKDWIARKIFLINLSVDGLEIDFPEAFSHRFGFE